jgi:hypothetical protein
MDWVITDVADSTYDTQSRSDLPRSLSRKSAAEIGDSVTIREYGDRIKVTKSHNAQNAPRTPSRAQVS